ncbi:GTPase [Arcanobacterium ihumii]|uniref:GTPase n=1 Tax=Arcanobacterium ihumii TaxID=2138162 RepID=UPI001F4341E0|nr:GTPase [Arcanobacterium ihumii]
MKEMGMGEAGRYSVSSHVEIDDAYVRQRVEELNQALQSMEPFINTALVQRSRIDVAKVSERTRFGAGNTVVALVGGTGSGKSTLFNALTGFEFADAGELRPTTERATACTWGDSASDLLDYLEVDEHRRINHSSILVDDSDLQGLVLLDLPDHDSIQVAHSVLVSRLIPMIDVLVWVLDPQKYADQVLHQQYLENLRQRSESMIVVLNHIDTVPPEHVDELIADLANLMAKDGLGQVPIFPISALHKIGLTPVYTVLKSAVQASATTARTAVAELEAIASRLSQHLALREPDFSGEKFNEMTDQVMRASGVPAVVTSINDAGGKLSKTALTMPDQPSNTMVVAIRDAWLNYLRETMPDDWKNPVVENVSSADRIRRVIGTALKSTPLPRISRTPLWLGLVLALLIFAGGVTLAVLGIPAASVASRAGIAAVAFVLALALFFGISLHHKKSVRRLAHEYDDDVRAALQTTLREHLVQGPNEVVQKHRRARELLRS